MTALTTVDSDERSNVSTLDRSRRSVRVTMRVLTVLLVAALCVVALGPLLWLFKAALSTSQDILREPFAWWPSGVQWQNLGDAWSQIHVGQYLLNTVWVAAGCWFFGLLVALTGGYGIAVLRPRYARLVNGAVLATLFIPGVVSLISLYVTVLDVPLIGVNLVNTFWAVWLPSADLQPLSVGLYRVSDTAPTNLLMAGMFISVVIPVVLFLEFQRQFLRSAGQAGAVKG